MPSKDRIYVSENITPDVLMQMFVGKTTLMASRAVAPFIGKWIRVRGAFEDLAMLNEKIVSVKLSRADSAFVRLYFRAGWDRLEILHGGEVLTIDGKIDRISKSTVELENCELVSVEAPESKA